jgi:deoxyribose-phosphate aldolase
MHKAKSGRFTFLGANLANGRRFGDTLGMTTRLTGDDLARRIDHTVLKPEATAAQIDRLCDEALEHRFAAVCVNPVWVARCSARFARAASAPLVCTVAGFPLGASATEIKAAETKHAIEQGALEVDMVANVGALIAGDRATVTNDIESVVATARRASDSARIKVILETRALTDDQIVLGCRCAADAGAHYVKTSTGFHPNGGATVEHVALLRASVPAVMKVKAAGGIRDLPTALAMVEAGADRLGMSASVAIIAAFRERT